MMYAFPPTVSVSAVRLVLLPTVRPDEVSPTVSLTLNPFPAVTLVTFRSSFKSNAPSVMVRFVSSYLTATLLLLSTVRPSPVLTISLLPSCSSNPRPFPALTAMLPFWSSVFCVTVIPLPLSYAASLIAVSNCPTFTASVRASPISTLVIFCPPISAPFLNVAVPLVKRLPSLSTWKPTAWSLPPTHSPSFVKALYVFC